jgi:hypothetical protein
LKAESAIREISVSAASCVPGGPLSWHEVSMRSKDAVLLLYTQANSVGLRPEQVIRGLPKNLLHGRKDIAPL